MRAGLRVATAAAMWAFVFVAVAHLHVLPERTVAPVVGAALWLVACFAIASGRPNARVRRWVVATGVAACVLLAGSALELMVDRPLVPELLAAAGFLATVQCFAATMAEIAAGVGPAHGDEAWERVTRWFLAFDAATMVLATAWVTGLVERRAHGRFRVSDLDLAPVGNAGWVLLVGYGVFAVVVGLLFLVETARMWAWARAADDAHDPSLRGR